MSQFHQTFVLNSPLEILDGPWIVK